jgi:autotransporter-associated beta strand protein
VASNTYWSAGTWDTAASGTGGAGTWDGTNGWDSSKTATFAGASGGAVSVGTVSASQGIQFSTTGYTLSSGSITLSGASSTLNTITTDTGVSAEISTPLTGTNGAYKAGAGTLTLSGDNSNLTGGLTISAGTLKLGNNAALGASSSSVAVSNGAVLDLNGATVSNTNALSINGTGVLVNTGGDASYAGNLTLTGASSIVSTTGAISIGGTTALGGNNLTLTGGAGNITLSNTISGTGNITITPGGVGAVTLSGGVNNTGTILVNPSTTAGNTVISGNIGSNVTGVTLGVSGQNATASNTQILTLSGTNTYTGSVNVYSGTLKLGSSSALGNSANALNISAAVGAALDLNGNSTPNSLNLYGAGIGSNSGVLINSSSTAATVSGTVTFSGNSSIVASGGDITFSGAIKNNGATQRNITIGGNTSTVTNVYVNSGVLQASANPGYIQLQIGSSGSDKVKVSLLGTQVIAPNGLVKIAGGTLALQSGSTLSASNMTLGSGGSLSDNSTLLLTGGSNYTFGSLGVGGNLTLDTTDSASAVNITFTNGGNSDTNTNGGQTGSSSKRIIANLGVTATIGAGGSTTYFDLVGKSSTPTSDKLLRIEGAGDVIVNSILRDNPATGVTWKGGINKSGTGTLTLNAANTYTASTTINAGTVKLGSGSALGDSAAGVTVYSAGTLNLNGQTMTNTNALTLSGTVTNDSGTAATYAGLLTVAGNNAKLNASSGNITLSNAGSIGFSSGTGYTLNLDGAYNGTINSILAIGTGNLNKTGAGNWTLSGSGATYSGTTNITNGSITLGASNVIGSGAVTINGGTLALGANSDTVGTVTLTSGSITGSTGTLTSNADYAVSSGTISGILAGSVGLNKTGAGTVTLSGLNTYTGVTTINAGTLEIYNFGGTQGNTGGVGANPSSLGQATNVSSKLLVNGTLRYLGSGETTDKKIKSGSTVTIDSSGTGALVFTSSPGESWMTGTTNSVLTLTGSNTGNNTWRGDILDNTTVNSTGTTSLVKSGAGTWVLSSSLVSNFSGGTTINDGTLKTAYRKY